MPPLLESISNKVPFEEVIKIYSELVNRTLLRFPHSLNEKFTIYAAAGSPAEAARVLEKALAEKGMALIPDGDKFTMLVPKAAADRVHPLAPKAKRGSLSTAEPARSDADPKSEEIPAGVINFPNVDARDVGRIYVEFVGRKLDPVEPFPPAGTISLRTQTAMTKEEVVYALETLFAWSGIKPELVGDRFVKFVPSK